MKKGVKFILLGVLDYWISIHLNSRTMASKVCYVSSAFEDILCPFISCRLFLFGHWEGQDWDDETVDN